MTESPKWRVMLRDAETNIEETLEVLVYASTPDEAREQVERAWAEQYGSPPRKPDAEAVRLE
jgi:hypothetical protein